MTAVRLVNTRLLSDDVAGLAGFYASAMGVEAVANDYYVELPSGATTLALCRGGSPKPTGAVAPCRQLEPIGSSWTSRSATSTPPTTASPTCR